MEEEKEQPSIKSVSIKWGAIGGLIGIIFFVVLDIANLSDSPVRWVGLLATVALIFLAHKQFKQEGDGFMNYSQGLGIGTLYSLIASVISSIFTFIYVSFINTEYVSSIREKALMDMENQGQSDAQIDQAMPFVEMFTSPLALLIMGIIGGVFFGFLLSLIVSIFTKKNSPEFV